MGISVGISTAVSVGITVGSLAGISVIWTFPGSEQAVNNEIIHANNNAFFTIFPFEKYFIKEKAIVDSEYLCETHYEQNEKDLKENKNSEDENIIKRIICDTQDDFKACNYLGKIYNNPVFMLNK